MFCVLKKIFFNRVIKLLILVVIEGLENKRLDFIFGWLIVFIWIVYGWFFIFFIGLLIDYVVFGLFN